MRRPSTIYSAIFARGVPASPRKSNVHGQWHDAPPNMRACILADRGIIDTLAGDEIVWQGDKPETITQATVTAWGSHVTGRLHAQGEESPLVILDIEAPQSLHLVSEMVGWVLDGGAGLNIRVAVYTGRLFAAASPWGDAARYAAAARERRDWLTGAIEAGAQPAVPLYPSASEADGHQSTVRAVMAAELAAWQFWGVTPIPIVGLNYADPGPRLSLPQRAATLSTLATPELIASQFRAAREYPEFVGWGFPKFTVVGDQLVVDDLHHWADVDGAIGTHVLDAVSGEAPPEPATGDSWALDE